MVSCLLNNPLTLMRDINLTNNRAMEKYKNKLWKDLESDTERAEFIESGRAFETGIIAKAIEKDLADVYRYRALANAETGEGQLTVVL